MNKEEKLKEVTFTYDREEWLDLIQGIDILLSFSLMKMLNEGLAKDDADKIGVMFDFYRRLRYEF